MMQRWVAILAALAGVCLQVKAQAAPAATNYPRVFEAVWSTVDQNFYDPTFHGVDWRAVGARYRAKLSSVDDDQAFADLMHHMLGELKVSHTYLAPPSISPAREVGVGMTLATIEGAPTVIDIAPLSDAHQAGLQPGDQLEESAEALYGTAGSQATLRVRNCNGAERTFSVVRGAALHPPEHPGWRWSRLSRGPGRTLGYLRVDRFDDGAADLADQAMDELKDTDGLIIDVRRNSGGNVTALRLASYFMPPGDAPAVALFARPYLVALGHTPTAKDVARGPRVVGAYTDAAIFKAVSDHNGQAVFYTEALGGRRYARPVIVLIGGDTGSAAEGFAWAMRLRSDARFVGRRTAGALLSGEEFPVGDGWTLTVPVQGLWGADGRDFADQAVSPDIPISWTREDVCEGHDPDIQRAMDLLALPR